MDADELPRLSPRPDVAGVVAAPLAPVAPVAAAAPELAVSVPPQAGRGPGPVADGGFVRRAAWSFAGQAVSSGSNFLLSVLVLSVAPAAEFATFSLCVITYALILQLARAGVAVPSTLLLTGDPATDGAQQRSAVGVAVGLGVAGAVVLLGVSLEAGHGRSLLVVLGTLLPLVLYQDALRYVCYARGRPSVAAASDLAWLALQVVASGVLFAGGRESATTLVAAWAGAGAVSGLGTGLYLRLAPSLATARSWLADHLALWRRLLGEFVLASSSHQVVWYGLALVAGAGELGRIKASQTLLGPVVVLIMGGGAMSVPESVRVAGDTARLRQVAVRLSGFLVAAAVVCGVAAYVLVPQFGPDLFPHAWEDARPLIPTLTLFAGAVAAGTGATAALRALDENRWLFRARAALGLVVVLSGVAASSAFGAQGALGAVGTIEWAYAVAAWRRLATVAGAGGSK